MADKMLIVHGYSDEAVSFTGLQDFFAPKKNTKKLYDRVETYFVEYSSMDDDASLWDFADKLNDDYNRIFKGERIDVACHSTGSLVVRAWLALRRKRQLANGQKTDCPVEHLLMFAPANFGSDLAKLGQSFLGKVKATFFHSNSKPEDFLESGKQVLQALEPASPFHWELSDLDLYEHDYFNPEKAQKNPNEVCFPYVFAAGNTYSGLKTWLLKKCKKEGTDGTVRICGTSLNIRKCTLNFSKRGKPSLKWHPEKKYPNIPFAVFNKFNHSTLISNNADFRKQFGPGPLAVKAVKVQNLKEYQDLAKEFAKVSEENYKAIRKENLPAGKFQQFYFKVTDDAGYKVDDYFLDFWAMGSNGKRDEDLSQNFDENFESEFYTHSADSTYRTMFANHKKLKKFLRKLEAKGGKLMLDITAKPIVSDITYTSVSYAIADFSKSGKKPETQDPKQNHSFLYANTTTFIEIVLDRDQSSKILHLKDHKLARIS